MGNYDFNECPNCGAKVKDYFASHMNLYKCKKCDKKFCYKCPGSNGGKKCPSCGSDSYETYGTIYKK